MSMQGEAVIQLLADSLARVPAIGHPQDRDTILGMLADRGYRLSVPPGSNENLFCYRIVKLAAKQAGALQQLARAVEWADRSAAAEVFAEEVARELPGDFFALDDRLEFIEDMRKAIQPEQLHMYYEHATGSDYPGDFLDVEDLLRELEELRAQETCHPLILLTEEIADRGSSAYLREVATRWSDRLALYIDAVDPGKSGTEQARLTARRKSQRAGIPAGPRDEHASVVFMLDPYVPQPDDRYQLRAWLYRNKPSPVPLRASDAPASLDDIKLGVVEELEKVIRKLSRPGATLDLNVEFFLPRALFGQEVEGWVVRDESVTLGTHFVVVVRDGDRLNQPALWPEWQKKWGRMPGVKSGSDGPFSRWITCTDNPRVPGEVQSALLLDEELIALGFTFPPAAGAGPHELEEALNAGIPIAVWPRDQCAHTVPAAGPGGCGGSRFKENLCRALAGSDLTELPRLIRKWRIQCARAGGSSSGAALLWDDPNRCPIPGDSYLDVPHHREGS